jgi:phosphatidylinositol alpha-mannosyltransferase
VQSHLGGDFEVLFNGVELDSIRSVEPWSSDGGGRPVVLFCGRHEERKGLRVLIDAMRTHDLSVTVWIGSEGPDTAELMELTAGDDRFVWLGRISDEEKFARLRTADVFCAPSLRGESFGVVLIEAMAAGTTVVASSLDGYRNVATHDVDALLVEPGDVAGLAEALRSAVDDTQLTERLRRRGSDRAEQFAMTALADRYVEIYRSLVGARAIAG